VVQSTENMVEAYRNIYEQLKNISDSTQNDLNKIYAKVLYSEDQKDLDTLEAL